MVPSLTPYDLPFSQKGVLYTPMREMSPFAKFLWPLVNIMHRQKQITKIYMQQDGMR